MDRDFKSAFYGKLMGLEAAKHDEEISGEGTVVEPYVEVDGVVRGKDARIPEEFDAEFGLVDTAPGGFIGSFPDADFTLLESGPIDPVNPPTSWNDLRS